MARIFFLKNGTKKKKKTDSYSGEVGDQFVHKQKAFTKLTTLLADIRATVIVCPGDGNIDGVVDASDLENWASYASSAGLSSVYDFNLDGLTDALDESIILKNMGLDCGGSGT